MMAGKKQTGISKEEIIWQNLYTEQGHYIITSKPDRNSYFLYEEANGDITKLGRAANPPSLIEKYMDKS